MTKLDQFLYWYTLIFSLGLIITALNQGFTLDNLTTIALFLPVPVFLMLQTIKRYYLIHTQQKNPEDQDFLPEAPKPTSEFSLKIFLTQGHPVFIITLILLITSYFILLLKTL